MYIYIYLFGHPGIYIYIYIICVTSGRTILTNYIISVISNISWQSPPFLDQFPGEKTWWFFHISLVRNMAPLWLPPYCTLGMSSSQLSFTPSFFRGVGRKTTSIYLYNVGPSDVNVGLCWLINPSKYSSLRTINHSEVGVMFTDCAIS